MAFHFRRETYFGCKFEDGALTFSSTSVCSVVPLWAEIVGWNLLSSSQVGFHGSHGSRGLLHDFGRTNVVVGGVGLASGEGSILVSEALANLFDLEGSEACVL